MRPRASLFHEADLREQGFTVVPRIVEPEMLLELSAYSECLLAEQDEDHFETFRSHGSMVSLDAVWNPLIRGLVTLPRLREALAGLGFDDVRWLSAYLISKPPHSAPLWWHQDWWAWDDPVSYAAFPPQLFAMIYLRDVQTANGALRVIPGSHRAVHCLAHQLPEAHGAEINSADLDSLAHCRRNDEVTVELEAGDVVFGDVRLLHATHPNRSARRRTCLTLWFLPSWERLPERIRAYVVGHPSLPPAGWWTRPDHGLDPAIVAMLPRYEGTARPAEYRRRPPRNAGLDYSPRGARAAAGRWGAQIRDGKIA